MHFFEASRLRFGASLYWIKNAHRLMTTHYTDKVNTDSSTDEGMESQPLEGFLPWGVMQPFYKLHRKFLDDFQSLAIQGENEGE